MLIKFLVYWLPPLVWMIYIFPTNSTLSADSTSHIIVPVLRWLFPNADQATIELIHIGVRKSIHFINYAFLALLLFMAFRRGNKTWRMEWIFYAGLIAIGYGSLDEYIQNFIPWRTGSVYDWLIDSSGAVISLTIVSVRNKKPALDKIPK